MFNVDVVEGKGVDVFGCFVVVSKVVIWICLVVILDFWFCKLFYKILLF